MKRMEERPGEWEWVILSCCLIHTYAKPYTYSSATVRPERICKLRKGRLRMKGFDEAVRQPLNEQVRVLNWKSWGTWFRMEMRGGERLRSPGAGSGPGLWCRGSCYPQGNVHVEKRTVSMNSISIKNASVNGISSVLRFLNHHKIGLFSTVAAIILGLEGFAML